MIAHHQFLHWCAAQCSGVPLSVHVFWASCWVDRKRNQASPQAPQDVEADPAILTLTHSAAQVYLMCDLLTPIQYARAEVRNILALTWCLILTRPIMLPSRGTARVVDVERRVSSRARLASQPYAVVLFDLYTMWGLTPAHWLFVLPTGGGISETARRHDVRGFGAGAVPVPRTWLLRIALSCPVLL